MLLKEIKAILGGDVSTKNSKMPGTSFGLSTDACKVGGKLREVEGSVCAKCYARRIENFRPSVKIGWQARTIHVQRATRTPKGMRLWVQAMVERLKKLQPTHHRWHDSGDIQSNRHMSMIISVAQECPEIRFWLPTKEKAIVFRALKALGKFPSNLTVRLSMPLVDQLPLDTMCPTSTVHSKNGHYIGYECPSRSQGNKCLDCRACWDSSIINVSYPAH